MNTREAKQKLDHVIGRSRVEMYKPIQIAEVLRRATELSSVRLGELETFRSGSRHWRDEVTGRLFGKVSTSSMRFQDDLWNPSAMPPEAMKLLGTANAAEHIVEAYIYSFVAEKSAALTDFRARLRSPDGLCGIVDLIEDFDDQLLSSADRLFEILALSVFQTELSGTSYSLTVDRPSQGIAELAVNSMIDLVCHSPQPLTVDRLGHTNAADGGLDIWTSFGVAVSVKRRGLTASLLESIRRDTPIGSLHIVCLHVEDDARSVLNRLRRSGERIGVTTKADLINATRRFDSNNLLAAKFKSLLLGAFDREFPMASTLEEFLAERGYNRVALTGMWKR